MEPTTAQSRLTPKGRPVYSSAMPRRDQAFISSDQLSESQIQELFESARLFKHEFQKTGKVTHCLKNPERMHNSVLALVFAEPSTRTRMSFQMAGARLGMRALALDNPQVASLSKGETIEDTLRNMGAMGPDLMVVRLDDLPDAENILRDIPCPVISGGIGTREHPTQALLDAYTIQEFRGQVKGEKVLFVGDVLHSRVANSNLLLLNRLGAEIAYCAPEAFQPKNERWKGVKSFRDLEEGFSWATVVMALRIQKERHQNVTIGLSTAEYREKFRIGGDQLKFLRDDGILLHPGPVIRGIEISDFAMNDSRCKVLDQVSNGVFVRMSLMSILLGLEVESR